jgi:SAM-dependent methyltransferase
MALLDELNFLKGLVSHFYRDVYGVEEALCFEHGRAGTCGVGDTPHCYHAHLCCFPVLAPIWKDIQIAEHTVTTIPDLRSLGSAVGKNPYLLVHTCEIDKSASLETAAREAWLTRVVALGGEMEVPRQYLRKLLAARLDRPELWDWAAAPGFPWVRNLCQKFRQWLEGAPLSIKAHLEGAPTLSFANAARVATTHGYDHIAHDYAHVWKAPNASMQAVMEEFIQYFTTNRPSHGGAVSLLDAGCGPGVHLVRFKEAGFDVLGIDHSEEMLATARCNLQQSKEGGTGRVEKQDAFDLTAFAPGSFDAVWYCALMVHLPRSEVQATLGRLLEILRPGGLLYISAQSGGDSILRREGRFFVYYSEAEMEALFRSCGFELLKRWHDTTDKGACGDVRVKQWINYFLIKPV